MSQYKNLTVRYVFALLLIATVMFITYSILVFQLQRNQNDAYIINISGMQRMLSQRIALFSREVHHAESKEEAQKIIDKMRLVTDKMVRNHQELTTGIYANGTTKLPSAQLKAIYFGENSLDAKVRAYTDLAQNFIITFEQDGWNTVKERDLVDKITRIARNGLLADLNRAVTFYQTESEADIERFKILETVFLLLGLSILCSEAFFIFRPMVKNVVAKTNSLERANRELQEFSYRISHDLRAPIVSSLGLLDVIHIFREQKAEQQIDEALTHIEVSLKRLETLIEEVINLTKMKQIDVPEKAVSISNMIDDILSNLENMEDAEGVEIRKNVEIIGDILTKPLYLQQVLENLISNAIKYRDRSKEQSFISVTAKEVGKNCHIIISDNGIGIPPDYRDQMFEMFKRFHPTVSFGSGLGLYLVKQNMEIINGTISYKPLDDGTEFLLKFPYKK